MHSPISKKMTGTHYFVWNCSWDMVHSGFILYLDKIKDRFFLFLLINEFVYIPANRPAVQCTFSYSIYLCVENTIFNSHCTSYYHISSYHENIEVDQQHSTSSKIFVILIFIIWSDEKKNYVWVHLVRNNKSICFCQNKCI